MAPPLTVAYVADESRMHQLLVSVASWMRFGRHPLAVVDIGLTAGGRSRVERLTAGRVTFLPPAAPPREGASRRAVAFAEKTLIGGRVSGDRIVFLDADILVTHPSFLDNLARVPPNTLWASRSAWDADFTWTYTPESLPDLRRATGSPDLDLLHPIVNSGVWAMAGDSARRVSPRWWQAFRAATDSPGLGNTLRPGTEIGDQEFLLPACHSCGVAWEPLPGSYNMQVHERRMPWLPGPSGHPLGGHPAEPAAPIRAVHYGCEHDGTVRLDPDMIAAEELRRWLAAEYAACQRLAGGG